MYKILKNVPVIESAGRLAPLTATLRSMEVGDMFTIPTEEMGYVHAYQRVKACADRNGMKVTVRKTNAGTAVWLVKKAQFVA